MTLTQEELAAYADGELEGAEAMRVVLAVAASPELMRMVQRHRALRERIGAEFTPILDQEVPPRLAALLRPPGEEAERDCKREPQEHAAPRLLPRLTDADVARSVPLGSQAVQQGKGRPRSPHRRWLLLPVLAAALAAAATLPGKGAGDPLPTREQRLQTPEGR